MLADDNQLVAFDAGVCSTVRCVLDIHTRRRLLQELACQLLYTLAAHSA